MEQSEQMSELIEYAIGLDKALSLPNKMRRELSSAARILYVFEVS